MMKHLLVIGLLSVLSAQVYAACDRSPRDIAYDDTYSQIYVWPGQKAEVTFPEDIYGVSPETPNGLIWDQTPFENKLRFSSKTHIYSGNFLVHGVSGKTYLLTINTREGCADSSVKLINKSKNLISNGKTIKSKGKVKWGLTEYMIAGKTPAGYRKVKIPGELNERLVFEQGSVKFYAHEQYVGGRYIGTVFHVINTGRGAFRVAIEAIDYQSPEIRKAFGRVLEIAMLPNNMRLGPAPEFASDLSSKSNEGLIFITSDKEYR